MVLKTLEKNSGKHGFGNEVKPQESTVKTFQTTQAIFYEGQNGV